MQKGTIVERLLPARSRRIHGPHWFALPFLSLLVISGAQAASVTVFSDGNAPRAVFAADEIQAALVARGHRVRRVGLAQLAQAGDGSRIVLSLRSEAAVTKRMQSEGAMAPGALKEEGYSLRTTSKTDLPTYWVIGADAAGVMYGGLELAEIIRVDGLGGVRDVDQNPYLAMRGTKFNIPLDARTPSYSDVCDAAQKNILEMWSLDFWKEYIDHLARYRYNFVSLWSLHPFPSMVKVPEYPDVALDDVKRSTVQWNEYYAGNGTEFDSPEILGNLETLKKMTIEEKIAFWREVMRYAKDRNVVFYVVTWNIFVNGTEGKYGITESIKNQTTIDYFRKSVRQMFLTYPHLGGIGLTTGENMPGASFEEKEDWAFRTYGQGVLDAAETQPGRKITLIHRQHQTGAKDIARRFEPLIRHKDADFIFSFKYAKAHVYSSTTQPYHVDFVEDIGDLETIWTLRNDDVYHFRWGAPDFVREFIRNIPHEVSKGFYLGSDQYIWGREFLSTEPESPRQIELAKHWYHWMLWGRLGYDPNLGNQRLIKIIQQRYPTISGADMFTAWQEASMIYPTTTGFHWGALDFQWYIEACKSRPGPAQTPTGFHDVNRFITLPPHPSTGNLSIADYVDCVVAGKAPSGTTPVDVSKKLHRHADKALEILKRLSHGGNKELRLTLGDVRAMAFLGKYYAHKIQGATELALFRKTNKQAHQDAAVEELTHAAAFWRLYASTALGQYENPLWTNRVGYCDWRDLFNQVLDDVTIAGGSAGLPSMAPTAGGTILEAESAAFHGVETASGTGGYTAAGYVDSAGAADDRSVQWTFDAPQAGTYALELRYALKRPGRYPCNVAVNGKGAGDIICWTTGGRSTWAWDRKPVVLQKGPNTIKLAVNGPLEIDHLNVLFGGASLAGGGPAVAAGGARPSSEAAFSVAAVLFHEQALARPHDVELQGDLAFVPGKGGSIAVIDVADPARPEILWYDYDPERFDEAETVLPLGDYLLLGTNDLVSLEIRNPRRPRVSKTVSDRARISRINGMAKQGDHVFAACKDGWVGVFDVGNPASPQLLGARNARDLDQLGWPHDVDRFKDHLVVVDPAGFGRQGLPGKVGVYRVADPATHALMPVEAWELVGVLENDDLTGANRVQVSRDHAFVAGSRSDKPSNFVVIDLSDPSHPAQVASLRFSDVRGPNGLTISGRMALLAGGQTVEAIDVTVPAKPVKLASYRCLEAFANGRDSAHDLVYRGGYLYVTGQNDHSLLILRVDDQRVRELAETGAP